MVCNGICNVFVMVLRIFCNGSIIFFSRVASLFLLYNAFLVILKAAVGLGLFL